MPLLLSVLRTRAGRRYGGHDGARPIRCMFDVHEAHGRCISDVCAMRIPCICDIGAVYATYFRRT